MINIYYSEIIINQYELHLSVNILSKSYKLESTWIHN